MINLYGWLESQVNSLSTRWKHSSQPKQEWTQNTKYQTLQGSIKVYRGLHLWISETSISFPSHKPLQSSYLCLSTFSSSYPLCITKKLRPLSPLPTLHPLPSPSDYIWTHTETPTHASASSKALLKTSTRLSLNPHASSTTSSPLFPLFLKPPRPSCRTRAACPSWSKAMVRVVGSNGVSNDVGSASK